MKFFGSKPFGKKAFVTLSALTLALGLASAVPKASADTGGDSNRWDDRRYYMSDMNDNGDRYYRDYRSDRGDRHGERHGDNHGDHRGDRGGDHRGRH